MQAISTPLAITLNAIEILDKFGIELDQQRLRKNETEIQGYCPFHDGHSTSFGIHVDSGVYHCFGCGAKGRIWNVVAAFTNLSAEEAQRACADDSHLPVSTYTRKPQFTKKKPPKDRSRYLTEPELDMLTAYAEGYHAILMGESIPGAPNIAQRQKYVADRGISMEATEYFKLGTTMPDYNDYYMSSQSNSSRFAMYPRQWQSFLKNVNLVNKRGGDYWWNPAIILPYIYDGGVYWLNTRNIPRYDDIRYIGMSGIAKTMFFHEDALDKVKDNTLYVVEGEFNAVKMWDSGFQNVVSFGSKTSLTDHLISKLYGCHVTLYFDTDSNDPDFDARGKAIQKMLRTAKSVSYFQLPEGVDINDYLNQHSKQEFEDEILSNVVSCSPSDEFSPCEYRTIPESQREQVISLSEAQDITTRYMQNVADNFPAYAGKRILINMPVGVGKSTAARNLVSSRHSERALILTSTHYNAEEYDGLLSFDTFALHLKGRAHPDVECDHATMGLVYAMRGYSRLFRMRYCYGVCGKARELEAGKQRAIIEGDPEAEDVGCLYLRQIEAARMAETLIATHAHGHLKGFMVNPYYGNERRSLVIVDEEADLVQNVYFNKETIQYNRLLLGEMAKMLTDNGTQSEAAEAAIELGNMVDAMDKARYAREGYTSDLESISGQATFALDKCLYSIIPKSGMPNGSCKLYDLAYAINHKLPFHYDEDQDSLFYTWRAVFPEKACVIFMSATTPRKYLEVALETELDEVIGEQYHVKRDNLEVVQLLNVAGGRGRLMGDSVRQESIKTFVKLALDKHQGRKVMIVTSQGTGKGLDEDDSVKASVIKMLNPIAAEAGRELLDITTQDLEEDKIESSIKNIPVIHYGIQGTNIFADYDVLIELNAHYYNDKAIVNDIHKLYGIDISEIKPVKQEVKFKTWDTEYTIRKHIHPDARVKLYIEATQMADIQQAEGRILRGEDTPKIIYRLHNVNIHPYPSRVYKSWGTMFKAEFGHAEITGKMAEVLEWIRNNVEQGREFTTKEIADRIGGYANNINSRYMGKLAKLGYIENVAQGMGRTTRWKRIL